MSNVIFNGPDGRLEGRYHHGAERNAPVAVVLHPHPQHGGSMNNKIVYALYRGFVRRGYSTLRFNFRGVGRSQGGFARGEGELMDAASALDWLQASNPDAANCWIGGFSFGAWIGMQLLMRRPEISGFISIAPPANLYDFTFLAPCPASGLVLQGSNDDVAPQADVGRLVAKLSAQRGVTIDYRVLKDADHFFTGRIEEMMRHVDAYLDAALATTDQA